MSAQKSITNTSSNLNFQNSYVRYKVGAPVVPVVKSIQTVKRQNYDVSIHNSSGNNQSLTENRIVENEFKDANYNYNNESINSSLSSRIPTPPAYTANAIYGEEMLLPVQGYFCSVCESFFDTHYKAYQEHCSTKSHYENYIKMVNESLKLQRSVEHNSKTLELSNDKANNPLPIKIKIENTDTLPANDNVKKPLSERLGAIKKNTKSKSSKKLKNQLFDGDYNKSILQFLPKPSSHITPSRKVFVEDYNINKPSNYGSNTVYSPLMFHNI